jgi:hypothetical protein
MTIAISPNVNSQPSSHEVEPRLLLVHSLRAEGRRRLAAGCVDQAISADAERTQ